MFECSLGSNCPFCHPEKSSAFQYLPFGVTITIQMVAPRILPVEQIKQALESACQFCSPTDLPVLKELKDESFITLAFSFATIYTEPSAMPASNRIEAVLSACRSEGLKMQQDDIQLENLDEQLAAIFAEAIK